MVYRRRPFNPLYPTPNQIITELNYANENFDILARAFVGDDPRTFIVKQADTVDRFHADLTPAPFTIPVADADGKIDVGWLPDDIVGGISRRINMLDAPSWYDLQVGEKAYYTLSTNWYEETLLNFRLTLSGSLYKLIIKAFVDIQAIDPRTIDFQRLQLYPNDTMLAEGEFKRAYFGIGAFGSFFTDDGCSGCNSFIFYESYNGVRIPQLVEAWINVRMKTISYSVYHFGVSDHYDPTDPLIFFFHPRILIGNIVWIDRYYTRWTSLGTLKFYGSPANYKILVERLM